jgi:hypothetical protein
MTSINKLTGGQRMRFEMLTSLISRIFLVTAFLLLGLAVIERVANAFDYTIIQGAYRAGRLLEYAMVFLVFVVALQIREVREALRPKRPQ